MEEKLLTYSPESAQHAFRRSYARCPLRRCSTFRESSFLGVFTIPDEAEARDLHFKKLVSKYSTRESA